MNQIDQLIFKAFPEDFQKFLDNPSEYVMNGTNDAKYKNAMTFSHD
jgi:apolipoprotein N-acyltransferase